MLGAEWRSLVRLLVPCEVVVGDPKNSKKGGESKGAYTPEVAGQLKFVMDNTYSKFRAKRVQLTFAYDEALSPADNDNSGDDSRATPEPAPALETAEPGPELEQELESVSELDSQALPEQSTLHDNAL